MDNEKMQFILVNFILGIYIDNLRKVEYNT